MLLSIKTKLNLTHKQKIIMSNHAGIARFTYNWGLATWNDMYKSGLKPSNYISFSSFPSVPIIFQMGITFCTK
ncbi:helix-turn-helix domain-containing protein [Calothrix rhizosoleniae]|uniref:helix-turn-helix domain-containing protein n=1 Tax=Calothrix rhizosoleniae TaxID=888997 RepID=UPI0022859386|nr:helix-turn-helix domain-containing protein [Calothrix rhizosoleniae]